MTPTPFEVLRARVEAAATYSGGMTSYVLSVLGTDRAGLVEALSAVVTEHGGNWERSHMTHLAGQFAGLVLVTLPDERASEFVEALAPLEQLGLLDISVERAGPVDASPQATPLVFEVVGNDHPGIVHEISRLLASLQVNIIDLVTGTESAAWDGGTLFRARAAVVLPDGLPAERLVAELEALANDLMVDIETERGSIG